MTSALAARGIDMGNTEGIDMVGTCMRSSFRAARFGGANATGIAVVKSAQQEPLKIDFVDACGLATQGHGLTDKGFADGTHPALPLDLAVVADVAHNPASPVADGLRSADNVVGCADSGRQA